MNIKVPETNVFNIDMAILAKALNLKYDAYNQTFEVKTGWISGYERCCQICEQTDAISGRKYMEIHCYGEPYTCYKIASYIEQKYGFDIDFIIESNIPYSDFIRHI